MKVRNGQSVFDVALKGYGSIEGVVDLAIKNGIGVTDLLQIGQDIFVGLPIKKDIISFFTTNRVEISTGAEMYYPPVISVAPTTLAYPNTIVGNTSSLNIVITNTGAADLELTAISLPAQFTSNFTPTTIAPNSTATFSITFTPTTASSISGNIVVSNNTESGINTVAVTATGIAATRIIGVTPTSLAFGTVQVGSTATRTFTITNTGNSTLTVTSIGLPAGGYTADWSSGTISAGASRTITVTFAPTTSGSQDGTITVTSNATSGANTVGVTGIGKLVVGERFDGINDYLISELTNLPLNADFSVSLFLKFTNLTSINHRIVSKRGNANENDFEIYYGGAGGFGGTINVFRNNATTRQDVNSTYVPTIGQYFHFVYAKAGNSHKFYINGIFQNMVTLSITDYGVNNTAKMYFATRPALDIFTSVDIFDAKVFTKELTLAEVQEIYNSDGSITPATALANLVLNIPFDSIYESAGIVYTEDTINADARPYGYAPSAPIIVDKFGNTIQTYP